MMRAVLLGLLISAVAAACNSDSGSDTLSLPDAGAGGTGTATDTTGGSEFPEDEPGEPEACAKMDIVFVVDNSASMDDEQANLAANFPKFYDVLQNYQTDSGALLDYRIAVTTTGTRARATLDPASGPIPIPIPIPPIPQNQDGDNGEFRQECGMSRRWLERDDPDVEGTFACVARVGTGGPSIEMQLYATKLAFSEQIDNGNNAGFLRDDALLAFVILSDEDDCSVEDNTPFTVPDDSCKPEPPEMEPLDSYLNFFDGLKEGRGRWAAAVIAGDSSCPDSFGDAARLRDFVGRGGQNLIFRPICTNDLSSALEDAISTFDAAC